MSGSHSPEDASLNMNGDVSTSARNDPQDILEKSDNLWQRLVQAYPDILRDNKEVQEIRKQLKNKEIIMCVFGRHNCGKSTLLNALLVNLCLPTNRMNETGVHIKIKHDSSVHPGYCTDKCQGKCPRLCDERNTTVGAEDIWDVLKEANSHHRQTGVQVTKEYTLYAHVPILEDVHAGWNLVLVDTPGFGEANMESITSLATTLLNTSSAYLYIVDVNSIGDETDSKNMRCIFDKDQKVFLDNRVVIAVTKYDDCHPKSSVTSSIRRRTEKVRSMQELQQLVCNQVKMATGMECPLEIIVPVSAEWADQARQLKHVPSDSSLRHNVSECLRRVPGPLLQGQGERAENIPSQTLATQLETSSGIMKLEQRMKEMIRHCIQSWELNLATGFTEHLGKVQTRLQDQLKDEQEHMADIQHAFQLMETYMTAKGNFMGKAYRKGETQIEKELKEIFVKDDMPEAKELVSRTISDLMKTFANALKVEVMKKDPPFGEESLQESIKKFTEEDLEPKLNTYLQGSRLRGVASVFRKYQHEVKEEDSSIEEAAVAFLPKAWSFKDDALRIERKVALEEVQGRELLESKELTVGQLKLRETPAIPRIKISWFQQVKDYLRKLFRLKVEARPYQEWSKELDDMVEKFEKMAITQAERYIQQDLKNWIASTLADIYYTQLKNRAQAITETFDSDIRSKEEELKMLRTAVEERIKKVSSDITELSENLRSLKELHSPGN